MSGAIVKTLQLSTYHISMNTKDWIDESLAGILPITIYEKSIYGWFILVPQIKEDADRLSQIPNDLRGIIEYALKQDCTWVMLDCDADTIPELPTFDWI